MQISVNFSETTIQQLKALPDANSFVDEVLRNALKD